MSGMFDEEQGGGRLNPADCKDHLLLVWAVGYIEHSPTKYSVAGKNSDVIKVDVVDLDQADSDGYQGLLVRNAWWRNGRLIGLLKERIGRQKPLLAWMTLGIANMGNAPYELEFAIHDPSAVARGQAWIEAHPDFKPTAPDRGRNVNVDELRQQATPPEAQPKSQLQQFAEQTMTDVYARRDPHQAALRNATENAIVNRTLPPPPPVRQSFRDEEIPF